MSAERFQVRQGDVLLTQVGTLPADAYKLAEWEGLLPAGHSIVGGNPQRYGRRGNAPLLEVFAPAELTHHQHRALLLKPGIYELRLQAEFDPATGRHSVWGTHAD